MGLDTLIVGRGGGSIEDLWAFNEEIVARAIFDADTPIISAVGHETDTTIADYVADLRAPTPSAGAELAVFDFAMLMEDLSVYRSSLRSIMNEKIQDERQKLSLQKLKLSRYSPTAILTEAQKKSLRYREQLRNRMKSVLQNVREQNSRYRNFPDLMERKLVEARHRLSILSEKMETASPVRKLSSGFSYVTDEKGHRVRSIQDVTVGREITTTVRDGSFTSRVLSIQETDRKTEG